MIVFVGTYTKDRTEGINRFLLDPKTGALTPLGVTPDGRNPSFLALDTAHRRLYAVNEVGEFDGQATGSVTAYTIGPDNGELALLNRQSSGGSGPCHLTLDSAGRNVLVANYGGGSVAVLPIALDGQLGAPTCVIQHVGSSVDKSRQEGPHAHSVTLDAANRFAIVADLGLDKLMVYRFDADQGKLVPNQPPFAEVAPGSGPRHFAFGAEERHAYVINEMASTITEMEYDAEHGTFKAVQTVHTLPQDYSGQNTTAEIQLDPSGRFLYGSNRGHNSIAIFAVAPGTGRLHLVGFQSTEGKNPRNFAIDPTGTFLLAANQDSDSIIVFRIDPRSGLLKPTGHQAHVPHPVCIRYLAQTP
jgi:6-phosphogluconolactonase